MIILPLLSLLLLLSCGKKSDLFFEQKSLQEQQTQQLTPFAELQKHIIIPHCLKCHKKSGEEEGLSRWIIAGDPENSKLYQVIKDGSMPKSAAPLGSADVELVWQYILQLPEKKQDL